MTLEQDNRRRAAAFAERQLARAGRVGRMTVIASFDGDYGFLSNGHEGDPFLCDFDGELLEVATAEHAYQARKARTPEARDFILAARTPFGPDGAKQRGRRAGLVDHLGRRREPVTWDAVKYDAMRDVLDAKFAVGSELAFRLMQTGDAELIEGNWWGDTCWGVHNGVGRNWLGTLLMARRAVLRCR